MDPRFRGDDIGNLNMLLAVDIGNTTVSLSVMHKRVVKGSFSVESAVSAQQLKIGLKKLIVQINKRYMIDKIVICSVVPSVLKIVQKSLHDGFCFKPMVVGKDIKVPIKNKYKNPKQVGQDRLVCAYAALKLYSVPAIVIDFGTAITFDAISQKGEYLGGIIVPGLRLSAESLFTKAALLPKIEIKKPKAIIGKDTQASILSGLYYGYGTLCKGMVSLLSKEFNSKPRIVVTGGHAVLMKKFIPQARRVVDTSLVFRGISLLIETI